ncbi:MAG: hypothetical protein BA871_00560 [Desulfuromonadales bacterium C00003096]|jgi:hypothetical protein|nr:MAG: hypothetical protein BA871_00560 [Desulfuromonadales bacterium C00003096]
MTPKFTLNQLLVRLAGLTGLSVEPAKAVVTAKFGTTASKHFSVTVDHKHMTLNGSTTFLATKLPLMSRLQTLFFLTRPKTSISTLEPMRRIGVNYRTVWRTKHNFHASAQSFMQVIIALIVALTLPAFSNALYLLAAEGHALCGLVATDCRVALIRFIIAFGGRPLLNRGDE